MNRNNFIFICAFLLHLFTASNSWSVCSTSNTDEDSDGEDCEAQGGADCDDTNPLINSGATEICDGVDNNCDGSIDEGLATSTYYEDADGDSYGTSNSTQDSCSQPTGYVSNASDCNDLDIDISPGATEVCDDLVDTDCDGLVDCDDADCDSDAACIVVPSSETACNDSLDDDSDGEVDCDDTDCDSDAACIVTPSSETACDDSLDDDADGDVDCDDTDCESSDSCIGDEPGTDPEPDNEDCDNGIDDDDDVSIDCEDSDCSEEADCQEEILTDFSDLEAFNETVNFSELIPGETVFLSAPDPREAASLVANLSTRFLLPETCSCSWTVDEEALAAFGDADACETTLEPLLNGDGVITIDVSCAAEDGTDSIEVGTYRQSFSVVDEADTDEGTSAGSSGCSLRQKSAATFSFAISALSILCALLLKLKLRGKNYE